MHGVLQNYHLPNDQVSNNVVDVQCGGMPSRRTECGLFRFDDRGTDEYGVGLNRAYQGSLHLLS